MAKRYAAVTSALVVVFAVIAGWSLWAVQDAGSPVAQPAADEIEKPIEPPPAPIAALSQPVPVVSAESGGTVPDEAVADAPAQTHPGALDVGERLPIKAGDFPPYLAPFADLPLFPRAPNGCKNFSQLLDEMSAESRDELWAPRMERELRALLGSSPAANLPLSVGCRSTICQVTALGRLPYGSADWHPFLENLQGSPLGSELTSWRFFAGGFPIQAGGSEHQLVSGFVLTSVGQGTPSEPPHCSNLQQRYSAPTEVPDQ